MQHEERTEQGDGDRDRARQRKSVPVNPDPSGDERGQSEQRRDIEDVRADDNPHTGVTVTRDDRGDRARDFGSVRPQRGDHAEQRFREAEPLADAVECAREDEARHDRGREPDEKDDDRDRHRHGRATLAARSGRLL